MRRSLRWLALGVVSLGGLAAAAGCDDTEGTGGAGTTSSATTTSSSSTTSTTTSASTGTGMMTGNHSFETATDIEVNDPSGTTATDVLVDVKTKNFYKFTGTAGMRLSVGTSAQTLAGADGDDSKVIDTYVTVYDSSKTPISQNDDAWPRFGRDSQAFVVLPADGDYFISVEECNSALGMGCAPATDLETFDYELLVFEVNKLVAPETFEGTAMNDTAAEAMPIVYKVPSGSMAGHYGLTFVDGGFSGPADVDFYSFTAPADTFVDAGQRAHAEFFVQPITTLNGDGSTSNVKITVFDSTDKVIAEVDQKNYSDGDQTDNEPIAMSFPITVGEKYSVKYSPSATPAAPKTDYYFSSSFIGSFYFGTLETGDLTNGTPLGAVQLTPPAMVTTGAVFVDGDITSAADVDYYKVNIPAGDTKVSLFCDAQRSGSGLRGATFGLYSADGTMKLGEFTEDPAKNVGLYGTSQVTLTGNPASILLKVSAPMQDPVVTGTFYHCTVAPAAM